MDHVPLLAPVTKRAWTEHEVARVASSVDQAFRLVTTPHRGPVFVDFPLETIYGEAPADLPNAPLFAPVQPDPEDVAKIASLLTAARRPVLVLGSDVWLGGADVAARSCAEALRLPVIANGQARGVLPGGHSLLVTRARSLAFADADLVIVVGVPLDFRLRYGSFGPKNSLTSVVHVADSPTGIATHCPLAASASGDLSLFFTALADSCGSRPVGDMEWLAQLRGTARSAAAGDAPLLTSDASPIHPMRVYSELLRQLDDDAVVIGDGGDFVSFAGRLIEPTFAGRWLDPGPYGCLGTGLGYAIAARIAHPSSQVVLLLGDGAAGLSLMDVDTLVRHNLPVVILLGNNSAWGLEKTPMKAVYGYDVAADLRPETRYDQIVSALGGAGELVTSPAQLAPALTRAFDAATPYLINVITDVKAEYPRTTTGV
jgi:acetolactate synthase-1/2/3 large subunit